MRWLPETMPAASSRRPGPWGSKLLTRPSCSVARGARSDGPGPETRFAMTTAASGAAGVIVGKRALHQMRAVLERETGAQAALLLREIGFATGAALWEAFEAWCRENYHVDAPANLD